MPILKCHQCKLTVPKSETYTDFYYCIHCHATLWRDKSRDDPIPHPEIMDLIFKHVWTFAHFISDNEEEYEIHKNFELVLCYLKDELRKRFTDKSD